MLPDLDCWCRALLASRRGHVTLLFDPFSYETQEDPFPSYERLRDEAPVWRSPEHGFFAISRHADVLEALRDTELFSNRHGMVLESGFEENADRVFSLLAMDPPRHDRVRALVSRGFTPRRMAALEPYVRALANARIDEFASSGRCDFIGDYAAQIPMNVISEMLGVPESDREPLRALADQVLHREEGSAEVPAAALGASAEMGAYFADWVSDSRRRDRDDLAGTILRAEVDGKRLSAEELIGFLFLLVIAGSETTRNLLGNAVYWLSRNPSERERVLADPALISAWVEETLRYDSPTQAVARLITRDAHFAGGSLCEGEKALLLLGSANRDARAFDDADVFRIGRDTTASLAFGRATHFCLGANLARLEARVCLEELLRKLPRYQVSGEGARRLRSTSVHGFASLILEFS
jgi:cytochrome P450